MNIKKIRVIVLTIILSYLVPSWQWNENYIFKLLSGFLPMMQTREVAWFISEQMSTVHTDQLDSFMKRLVGPTELTQYVWTNRTDIRMSQLLSKRNGLTIVFTTGALDPIMHVYNRVLTGRHASGSIVIYVSKAVNLTPIEDICYTLYKASFFLSFVYFETVEGHNLLYGFEQYPTFTMENRTDIQVYVQKLVKKMLAASQDVGGYKFFTPIQQDLPKVFKSEDKHGNSHLHGTAYDLLQTFIHSLNGSMQEYQMPKDIHGEETVNMKNVLDLVRSRKIDLSTHAYALYQSDDDLDKSYPIMVVQWCLMVPQRNSISTYLYLVQPFENRVWLLVVGIVVALCGLDLLWILWITRKFDRGDKFLSMLSDAWLDDFCFVLNIAASKTIRITTWTRFNFYIAIFFFGFFLSANYTSYLGSSLTVALFRDQINSMQDIVQAQLPVMVVDYELEFLLSEGYEMPQEFRELLRPVDTTTFAQHQLQFNTSFAYFVTDDTWHFLDEAQKHLRQRVFKFSDICFGSYHLAYPIQRDSAVWRDLEYFVFRTHSNGLIHRYGQTAFQSALSAGYIQRLMDHHEYTSAGWEHLVMLFLVLGIMYLVGGISLIAELIIHRFQN